MTLSYLRFMRFLINLQMTLSYEGELQGGLTNFQSVATSKLRQPAPELAAAGTLGLLPVHQKLQNSRFHVWFLDVVVDVAQRVVDVA